VNSLIGKRQFIILFSIRRDKQTDRQEVKKYMKLMPGSLIAKISHADKLQE